MEHNKCGCSDLADFFEDKTRDRLICPKCNKELKLIGVDYFRLESAFKCRGCTIIFSNPYQIFDCNDCGMKNIKFSDLAWKNIFAYSISPLQISGVKQQIISLDDIQKYLTNSGFRVDTEYRIQSNYESLGPFDIWAQKGSITIIINSLGDNIEDNVSKLFELNSIDKVIQGTVYKIAILFSEPREVTKNMMDNFNIKPIVVDDILKISDEFREQFSQVFLDGQI